MADLENSIKSNLFELILEYIANPLDNRPVKMFCDDIGISESTYYRFHRENRDRLNSSINAAREKFVPELRARAYKHLNARLGRSDAALKLFFQLIGDLVERTESKFTMMTPDEKREQLKTLLASLTAGMANKSNDPQSK